MAQQASMDARSGSVDWHPRPDIPLDVSKPPTICPNSCPGESCVHHLSADSDGIASMKERLDLERIRYHIFHPIHRLPTELLVKTFHHCIDADWNPKNSLCVSSSPWVVSQVCKTWRDAALGDPLLWSDIRISDHSGPPTSNSLEAVSHRIEHQLLRSGSCPLHITIDGIMFTSQTWADVPQLLFSHCKRFKVLEMSDHDGILLSKLISLGPLRFPTLRRIVCRLETLHAHLGLDVFHSCPKLQSARFYSGRLLSLPWSQLTELSCDPCEIYSVLPSLTNVARLQIFSSAWTPFTLPESLFEPILLPNVRQLDVQDTKYLKMVTAPLVQDLTVRVRYTSQSAFFSFLSRSKCQITSFTLDCLGSSKTVIRLLGAMPELTSFSWIPLIPQKTAHQVIVALSELDSGQQAHLYCPKLEQLTIDCSDISGSIDYRDMPDSPGIVYDVLALLIQRMRVHGERGFKRVELTDVGAKTIWKEEGIMLGVRELRERGLELIVNASASNSDDATGPAVVNVI